MNIQRAKLKFYVELLTQVKRGNSDEASLIRYSNLSQGALNLALDPLVSEKLLKKVKVPKSRSRRIFYQLTENGDKFIDFLGFYIN